jgi:hypothetical protein
MFLNLSRDIIRSAARFRLRVHTLRFETATWNHQRNSPIFGIDDIQDEQCDKLFHCANPHVISLCRKYVSLFFPSTGAHEVSKFISQNNIKLYFFLRELIALRAG